MKSTVCHVQNELGWRFNSAGKHLAADRRGSHGGVVAGRGGTGVQVSNSGNSNPGLSFAAY